MNPESWYINYPEEYKNLYSDLKKTCLIFGGTGGIGQAIIPQLDYDIISLGSKDLDLNDKDKVFKYIKECNPSIVLYLVGTNYNSYVHKLNKIDDYINININSFINVLSSSISVMRTVGYGRFIYASSILSKKFVPGCSLYSSSKAFNEKMVINSAKENGKYNITVNALRLGYFNTGMIKDVPESILEEIKKEIPSGKLGNPNQIVNIINTIIENDYINGSIIDINGAIK